MDGLANLTTNFRLKPLIVLDDKVQKFQLKSITLMSYCYSREQTNKIKYSIVHSTIDISPVLDDCRQLASRFQQIQFNHCYRQANHVLICQVESVLSKSQISFCFLVHLWTCFRLWRMTVIVLMLMQLLSFNDIVV